MPRFILASASPRRQQLLREIVADFEVLVQPVDEDALTTSDPWETATTLALAKARAVAALNPEATVLGGDTVVAYAGDGIYRQLAKPGNAADARRMLRELSGRTHVVITGIALVSPAEVITRATTTEVDFRELTESEIADYVATGEPMDKAGAYAIQGGAAGFVREIRGSWSNVVGLPLETLGELLA